MRAARHTAPLLAVALLVLVAQAASSAAAARSAAPTQVTIYAMTAQEQFINNEDDRARGKGNNPFGNYKDTTAVTHEAGKGPFPGDEAVFQLSLFSSSDRSKRIGTGTYTCQYGFNRFATCDAWYQLSGGTLVGTGTFSFDANRYEIAVTGGTGKFRSMIGNIAASPGPHSTQRLAIAIHPA